MNNRQTNRRRGRGNNNRTQNNNRNGYDHQNRIDNRARGNASQMLEKFKKLAQDAQLNGDRVQAEYYHQFADHYFRVLADFRSRQEENRPQREWRDDREGSEWRDDERDMQEEGDENDAVADSVDKDEDHPRPQHAERHNRHERGERSQRGDRTERSDRGDRNPRGGRNKNARRDRGEAQDVREEAEEVGLDLSILPPSIAISSDEPEMAEEKPVRKPRARRAKSANDENIVTAAE